jgi:hypothetical protein
MNKLAKLLPMIGAAIVLIFGTAPAALAGTDATATVCYSYCPAAHVIFHNNGDWVRVCDDAADGYAVVIDGYGPQGELIRNWNTHGVGTCADFYYDFSDGYTIQFRVCLGVASTNTLVTCGPWVSAVT